MTYADESVLQRVSSSKIAERDLLPRFLFCMLIGSKCSISCIRLTGRRSFASVNQSRSFEDIQIPLPPLEVQKEIVAEIEGYQKVIDGARAVLDNYRPHIPIHPDWPMVELGDRSFKTSGRNSDTEASQTYGWQIPCVSLNDMTSRLRSDDTRGSHLRRGSSTKLSAASQSGEIVSCRRTASEHRRTTASSRCCDEPTVHQSGPDHAFSRSNEIAALRSICAHSSSRRLAQMH